MFGQPGLVGGMMTGTATTDESANSFKKSNLITKLDLIEASLPNLVL